MNEENNNDQFLLKAFARLLNLVIVLLVIITGLTIGLIHYMPEYVPEKEANDNLTVTNKQPAPEKIKDTMHYWIAPDEALLNENPNKEKVIYGRDLIVNTSDYFGANGKIFKASTNGMNCQNCHLDAGTKVFGNNYSAVGSTYPKYRARSGSMENIFKRVNDCFERSLNGKVLDTSSNEMLAIVAYIKWLGKDVPKGEKPVGSGFQKLAFLDRASYPEKGSLVYTEKCQSCHKQNGEGLLNGEKNEYTYPPLWGEHSYNSGAGLYRISNFARFVKYNMPLGASHTNVQLTDEEAWDVAAFVNSQPRPEKNIKKDWPKLEEKPFDHPFGPYADTFSEAQHKYGPYQSIIDASAKAKKK